jgi:hypothetical protein
MSITYTWDFSAFEAYPLNLGLEDVVFSIHWHVLAKDITGHKASIYGVQEINLEKNDPFTPYSEITFEQAKLWVQSAMGINAITALQENLNNQIADLNTPKIKILPAPWKA